MNNITLKWIISIIISVTMGTFIMNILGTIEVNVWITRIVGAVVTAIIELFVYNLWIKDKK